MFGDIWNKVKEIVRKMLPKKTVEDVLHITPHISDRMAEAIQLWADMYEGRSPWIKEPTYDDPSRIVSLGLPSLIASEKARMATLEMKSEISAPMQQVAMADNPNASSFDQQTNLDMISPEGTDIQPVEAQPSVGNNKDSVVGGANVQDGVMPSAAYQQTMELVPTGPTERADFLNTQYKKLLRQIRRQLEYGIAKGGIIIKPYVVMYENSAQNSVNTQNSALSDDNKNDASKTATANANDSTSNSANKAESGKLSYNPNLPVAEIEFDFVQADRFFPLSFDANGKVLEAAFIQTKVDKAKERVYIRLEYHKLEKRKVTVQNLAFESTDMSLANNNNIKTATNLGRQIKLTDVEEWASLQPTTVIENVDRLLFAYFRMPEANTVDPYSPLGVSGYSRVTNLIKDADMQYSRLLWEFEGGEMAIDVDRDALKFITDPNGEGRSVLPQSQQRLFRKIDLNAEDTYNVFAPTLRDTSISNGLNIILTRIEDACGLSRGTLSQVDSITAKTATELKILKQRSYATNQDIQMALQEALEDAIYVMDVYSTLYEITPPGEYEASFEWDDSIIVDSESELSKRITLMQNKLASHLEIRMWYFGETENQARAALQQIDKESTQAMIQNAQAQIMQANAGGGNAPADEKEDEKEDDSSKGPGDTTAAKKSTGKQADDLDNPNKNKANDGVKGQK